MLTAAVWRSGGQAVIEFIGRRGGPRPADVGAARGDAWVKLGRQWYTVEAKMRWSPAEIERALGEAVDDLRGLHPDDRQETVGLALCYCAPQRRTNLSADSVRHDARRIPASLGNLVAAYRPVGDTPRRGDCGFPGLIIVGRTIRWD